MAVGFHGSEEQLVECIIGYTPTEKVALNVGSRIFERISQDPKLNPPATDVTLLQCPCFKDRLI